MPALPETRSRRLSRHGRRNGRNRQPGRQDGRRHGDEGHYDGRIRQGHYRRRIRAGKIRGSQQNGTAEEGLCFFLGSPVFISQLQCLILYIIKVHSITIEEKAVSYPSTNSIFIKCNQIIFIG